MEIKTLRDAREFATTWSKEASPGRARFMLRNAAEGFRQNAGLANSRGDRRGWRLASTIAQYLQNQAEGL